MRLTPLLSALAIAGLGASAPAASEWLAPAAPGLSYPDGEADRQWAFLTYDLTQKARFAAFAPETFRAEALVTAADRDPLDVLLRRTAALLADLRAQSGCRDLDADASPSPTLCLTSKNCSSSSAKCAA